MSNRRVCPGAYLAELEIFNVWVRLFSQCSIEPRKDELSVPVFPDINKIFNKGIVYTPTESRVCVVKRKDALI